MKDGLSQKNRMAKQLEWSRIAVLIGMVLILAVFSSACGNSTVRALTEGDIVIASFSEARESTLTVSLGTAAEDIGLPDTLSASVSIPQEASQEGEQIEPGTEILELREVPVAWVSEEYDPDTAGAYLFTAVLQPGFVYEGTAPTIQVEVQAVEDAVPSNTPDVSITPEPSTTPEPSSSPDASASPEITPTPDPALDYVISSFANEPLEIFVERGTTEENLPLPATLPAINGNGAQIEVPVVWTCDVDEINERSVDETIYAVESRYGYGPWIFTATISNPDLAVVSDTTAPETTDVPGETTDTPQETAQSAIPVATYTYAGEPVTACVRIQDCTDIASFCGISDDGLLMRFVIFEGGTVHLPDETGAFMSDGGYQNVPINWSGRYDTDSAGTYTLHMHVEDGYSGGGRVTAEIVVLKPREKAAQEGTASGDPNDGNSVQVIG